MKKLTVELARLRMEAIARHPHYRRSPNALGAVRGAIAHGLSKAKKAGAIEELRNEKGRLDACFFYCQDRSPQTGRPILAAGFDCRQDELGRSIQWLEGNLRKRRKQFAGQDFNWMLQARYGGALDAIYRSGLYVEAVALIGKVREARRRLKQRYGPLDWEQTDGFRAAPISSRRDVDAAIALHREEFSRNPQFGWFAADPRFLAREKSRLLRSLQARQRADFAILRGDRIVGYFGATLMSPHPVWGSLAGLTFCFDRSIQGKGLSKIAYDHVLIELAKARIYAFTGGTSQIPTLRLARLMGREPFVWVVKSGKARFPRSHFAEFDPANSAA